MKGKKIFQAVCICFAVSIFFYPVKQISCAPVHRQNPEVGLERESKEIPGELLEQDVPSPREEELRNEAESPQEAPGESVGESGWYGNRSQGKSSDGNWHENGTAYGGNDLPEPSDESGNEQEYKEDGRPGEPHDEHGPEQQYEEEREQPFDELVPENGGDENQPIQIEGQQTDSPSHKSGW